MSREDTPGPEPEPDPDSRRAVVSFLRLGRKSNANPPLFDNRSSIFAGVRIRETRKFKKAGTRRAVDPGSTIRLYERFVVGLKRVHERVPIVAFFRSSNSDFLLIDSRGSTSEPSRISRRVSFTVRAIEIRGTEGWSDSTKVSSSRAGAVEVAGGVTARRTIKSF